jgi:hypothetical protein
MKTNKFLFSMILCLALALAACSFTIGDTEFTTVTGSGNVTTEERPVSGVERVVITNQGNLTVVIGDTESLVIEAEDNLLQYIQTEVRNGTLEINTQNGVSMLNKDPIRYTLTVKSLKGIDLTSSGNASAPALTADSFEVNINSSGNASIENLTADKLTVHISSSGKVEIAGGTVGTLDVTISSSGDLHMEDVAVQDAKVSISSSGSAYLQVSDNLDGNISSSGNIYVTGNPQVDVNTSSSGKVVQR